MRIQILLFTALLGISSTLQAADWHVDAAASTLQFSGTAEGMAFTGQFHQFSPKIRFDPTDLAGSRFEVEIALASADTANAERDETLQGSDFFASKRFPSALFVAGRFRDLGEDRFAADGSLGLRGVEKPVTLEFTWAPDGAAATLDGTTTLNRLDFAIGAGDWADDGTVSHRILVRTHLQLEAANTASP